jgi:hypothetical protein
VDVQKVYNLKRSLLFYAVEPLRRSPTVADPVQPIDRYPVEFDAFHPVVRWEPGTLCSEDSYRVSQLDQSACQILSIDRQS